MHTRGGHGSGFDSGRFLRFLDPDPVPEAKICEKPGPDALSTEISDLLLFVSYFASQSKGMKYGVYFFDVCWVN